LEAILERTLGWLGTVAEGRDIGAVGHRIVHGGREFRHAAELTPSVLKSLEALAPLAPLHQPFNLHGAAIAAKRLPRAVHAGVFDTAFHADQPELARLYALPRELIEEGVIAYGFHGLSYEYIAGALAREEPHAGGRAIVMHLGSGVSLCAMNKG